MPNIGWIYVLTNQTMPDLVKVGLTTSSPEQRTKELSSATGVASKFEIAASLEVSDVSAAEKKAHSILERVFGRPNQSREFFKADAQSAIEVLEGALAEFLLGEETDFLNEAAKLAYSKSFTMACLQYENEFKSRIAGAEIRLMQHNLAEHYGIYLGACVAINRLPIYPHLVSSVRFKSQMKDKAVEVLGDYISDADDKVMDFMRSL